MKKNITTVVVFAMLVILPITASFGFPFSQDYFMQLARVRSAERLFGKGDYAQAQDAFEQLAAKTDDPVEASQFMTGAAGAREADRKTAEEAIKAIMGNNG